MPVVDREGDPFHERVYIHILALVGLVVKKAYDEMLQKVCTEVFGDTFKDFHRVEIKGYPRMVANCCPAWTTGTKI